MCFLPCILRNFECTVRHTPTTAQSLSACDLLHDMECESLNQFHVRTTDKGANSTVLIGHRISQGTRFEVNNLAELNAEKTVRPFADATNCWYRRQWLRKPPASININLAAPAMPG